MNHYSNVRGFQPRNYTSLLDFQYGDNKSGASWFPSELRRPQFKSFLREIDVEWRRSAHVSPASLKRTEPMQGGNG